MRRTSAGSSSGDIAAGLNVVPGFEHAAHRHRPRRRSANARVRIHLRDKDAALCLDFPAGPLCWRLTAINSEPGADYLDRLTDKVVAAVGA
jgi:hypothetical protein